MTAKRWRLTANDIRNWTETNKRKSEELLPLLVKKLIIASCLPEEITFPTGDAIAIGGWDGLLVTSYGNNFVPSGTSGWEFGTNKSVKSKADKDYEKRTSSPEPLVKSDSTYVFVTSRLWTRKDSWSNSRRSEGEWHDVVVLDAESLAEWLEECPAVHRWFSHVVGKLSGNVSDVEQSWSYFSNYTGVQLTSDFFLHSRINECQVLKDRLNNSADKHVVKAGSYLESLGFCFSLIKSSELYSSRFLSVKDQASWDDMINTKCSLILLPFGFQPTGIGDAISKGHHVILPVNTLSSEKESIHLLKRRRLLQQEAIEMLGFTSSQAGALYSDTKGYIEPLLRHELLEPKDSVFPCWVEQTDSDLLFTALFAGEWNCENEYDRKILSILSGKNYDLFDKELTQLSLKEDAPVRKIAGIWQVISKVDMWFLTRSKLTSPILTRLGECAKQLFSEIDTSYQLTQEEQFFKQFDTHTLGFSSCLKSGVADSLALLAAFGDSSSISHGELRPSELVRQWLRNIFTDQNNVGFWYTLGKDTQLLAEAAPDEFLKFVIDSSSDEHSAIQQLFELETGGPFGGSWYHTNMLWALEIISWKNDLFTLVVQQLARMSAIDPGGVVSNRPMQSLVDIFLGWTNNSKLLHSERFMVLKQVLVRHHPQEAWQLMIKLLPGNVTSTSGIERPRYQDWTEGYDEVVYTQQYAEYTDSVFGLIIQVVLEDVEPRLLDLFENLSDASNVQLAQFIEVLKKIDIDALSNETSQKLADSIRCKISQHRKYPNANWSWPNEILSELETVFLKLSARNELKDMYLFDEHYPRLLNPSCTDSQDEFDLIAEMRVKVILEISSISGIKGIKDLIERCELPREVAIAIYHAGELNGVIELVIIGLCSEGSLNDFATSYVEIMSHRDYQKAEATYQELISDQESNLKVQFLINLPVNERTLELVKELNSDVQGDYWKGKHRFLVDDKNIDLIMRVSKSLLQHKRAILALKTFSQAFSKNLKVTNTNEIDVKLCSEILVGIAVDEGESLSGADAHYIQEAIKFCQDSGLLEDLLVQQIEWLYIKALKNWDFKPIYIEKEVITKPESFVHLVCYAYKRNENGLIHKNPDERDYTFSQLAWCVIDALVKLPGAKNDTGDIDEADLSRWIYEVRGALMVKELSIEGDKILGGYLSSCSVGSDGVWPHESVRSVIETIQSDNFDRAFLQKRLNSRGVTVRHQFAGGDQERHLAESYAEDSASIQYTYPRTSKILRRLAESYLMQADRQDLGVEVGL